MKNKTKIKNVFLIGCLALISLLTAPNSSFAQCNINAGGDISYCFDTSTFNLFGSQSGIDPASVSWSNISSPSAVSVSISSPASLTTTFTRFPANATGNFVFVISGICISNGTSKTDTVTITITPAATIAQIFDANGILVGDTAFACTSIQLKGNVPASNETGFWTFPAGQLASMNRSGRTLSVSVQPSANSSYCLPITAYYTISNGGCSSTKKVTIEFERGDQISIVGSDTVSLCGDTINVLGTPGGCKSSYNWRVIPITAGISTPYYTIGRFGSFNSAKVYFTQSGTYQIIYDVVTYGLCPGGSDTVIYNVCVSNINGIGNHESTTICDSFPDTVFLNSIYYPSLTYGDWKISGNNGIPPASIIQTSPGQAYALIFDNDVSSYSFDIIAIDSSCVDANGAVFCGFHKNVYLGKGLTVESEDDTLSIFCKIPGKYYRPRDFININYGLGHLSLKATSVPSTCSNIVLGNSYSIHSSLDFSCDGTYTFVAISSPCKDTMKWTVIVSSLQNPSAGSDSYIKICDHDTVPLVGSLPIDVNGNINNDVTGLWTQVDGNPAVTFLGSRHAKNVDVTNFSVVGTYMFVYSFSLDANCYLADTMFVIVDSCVCPEFQIKTKCELEDSTDVDSLIFFSSPIGFIYIPPKDTCDLCDYRIDSIPIVVTNEDTVVNASLYNINWSHDISNHSNTSYIKADEEVIVTVSGPDSCFWSDTIMYICDTCRPNLPDYIDCETTATGRRIYWGAWDITGKKLSKFASYEIEIIWNDPSCCSTFGLIHSQIFTTTDRFFDITGFSDCFSYRIRTVCEDGTVSPWSTKKCSCNPPCVPIVPTNLRCQENFFGFQMLSWDFVPGATYEIEFTWNDPDCCPDNGALPYMSLNVTNNNYYFVMTGCFSWRVRSICPDGTKSPWSQKKCSCEPVCVPTIPTNLYCSTTLTGQFLWWDPVPDATYEIFITWGDPACCPEGNHFPYVELITTSNPSHVINNLSGCFSWKVRSVCPDGTVSAWSQNKCSCPISVVTICPTPTNLDCKGIANSGQSLTWDPVFGATYEVEINDGDPSCCSNAAYMSSYIVATTTPSHFINSTFRCFSWRVRTICSDGTISGWSAYKCSCPTGHSPGGGGPHGLVKKPDGTTEINKSINVTTIPNPAVDLVTFNVETKEVTKELGELVITDVSGSILITSKVKLNGSTKINLDELENGVYIYSINAEGIHKSGRIVITK